MDLVHIIITIIIFPPLASVAFVDLNSFLLLILLLAMANVRLNHSMYESLTRKHGLVLDPPREVKIEDALLAIGKIVGLHNIRASGDSDIYGLCSDKKEFVTEVCTKVCVCDDKADNPESPSEEICNPTLVEQNARDGKKEAACDSGQLNGN